MNNTFPTKYTETLYQLHEHEIEAIRRYRRSFVIDLVATIIAVPVLAVFFILMLFI